MARLLAHLFTCVQSGRPLTLRGKNSIVTVLLFAYHDSLSEFLGLGENHPLQHLLEKLLLIPTMILRGRPQKLPLHRRTLCESYHGTIPILGHFE